MGKFIGRLTSVGIGKETTRGVGVPAEFSLPKTSIDFDAKANKAVSGESLGVISEMGNQAIVTAEFSEGSIEGEINVNSFGLLFVAILGGVSSVAELGAFKHTYSLLESNQHQSLSVLMQDGDLGDTIFKNCMVDSFEMTVAMEDPVKFNVGLKGKKPNTSDYTPVYAEDYKFVGRDLEFKVASSVAGLAGASAVCLKDLNITINKNAEYDYCLGTLEADDIHNKQIKIEGSITLNYEDRTWRDYMLNGDYKAIGIKLTNTRDAIGTNLPKLYLELPRVHFSEWESARENDEIAKQSLNFTALYDLDSGKLISDAYIVNTTVSY